MYCCAVWNKHSSTDRQTEQVTKDELCSCVQDISVTLCEENITFWEVSGIGSEVIGLLWNLSFLEYYTGLFFLGLFLSSLYLSFLRPLLVALVLWFLTVVSVSDTQGINSTNS